MIIKDMFKDDIDRKINGVVKVTQDDDDVIKQEVREYVVTRELKKHFIAFFNSYAETFDAPNADVGVWISGFFGSGKSHFLKMLSYILQNREIDGVKTVEYFREKLDVDDDPGTFIPIDRSVQTPARTILFNIDIESAIAKSKSAVTRVFAKMFYDCLGFCGDDLKVALLEQHLDQEGKLEEFRQTFEALRHKPWESQRKALAFNRGYVDEALNKVLGMSENDVEKWLQEGVEANYSIANFVQDVKRYVDAQSKDFRLLFMIDEVGQFIGEDLDKLLNLQSIIEELGAKCNGKVWVVCTGQEAVDELLIKLRVNEFSRIRARFKTNLSLSSSSVDEVIQKRVLQKKPDVTPKLKTLYEKNDSELRNLFAFTPDTRGDIKGFTNADEFARCFPFVPYQFKLMQSAFKGIRAHGFSGKHMSVGERSMLSGFQEAAQEVKDRDEYALVPFYRFYNSIHGSLDSSVRNVIDRCRRAAEDGNGVEIFDVDVLKLLYLIRYTEVDIRANVENIVILMADSIRMNKIELREKVKASLDRLRSQNYIRRSGELYNFLTDEEQDVQKEINAVDVEYSSMLSSIARVIFDGLYSTKKHRYGCGDFQFERGVDAYRHSGVYDEMKLRFLTPAVDTNSRSDVRLTQESYHAALFVLKDDSFYDKLERAEKIKTYVEHCHIDLLPQSKQEIIRARQEDANVLRREAGTDLENAIKQADVYVDGDRVDLDGSSYKAKIDAALNLLVRRIYKQFDLVKNPVESDDQIRTILTTEKLIDVDPNQGAVDEIDGFLKMQFDAGKKTTMAELQSRYQKAPYGWREIDVAAFVARLLHEQKVVVKRFEQTIPANDPNLPNILRKASETGKTIVETRQHVSEKKIRQARKILQEYFDVADVAKDEDALRADIERLFSGRKASREELLERYVGKKYPDRKRVERSLNLADEILKFRNDPIALISAVVDREDELVDDKEDMLAVEEFFESKYQIFDDAVETLERFDGEIRNGYYANEVEAKNAIETLRAYLDVDRKFNYAAVPKFNGLLNTIRDAHNRAILAKRAELREKVAQCEEAVRLAVEKAEVKRSEILDAAKDEFKRRLEMVELVDDLLNFGSYEQTIIALKDGYCRQAKERRKEPEPVVDPPIPPRPKNYQERDRKIVFEPKILETEADVDAYLDEARERLIALLQDKNFDGVELK